MQCTGITSKEEIAPSPQRAGRAMVRGVARVRHRTCTCEGSIRMHNIMHDEQACLRLGGRAPAPSET